MLTITACQGPGGDFLVREKAPSLLCLCSGGQTLRSGLALVPAAATPAGARGASTGLTEEGPTAFSAPTSRNRVGEKGKRFSICL